MVKRSCRRPFVKITGDGIGIASHAGTRLLADLADAVGLNTAMSAAMAMTKQRRRGHDRGEVLVDLAVAIADGAETISDLAVLRNQPELFGEVASHPTTWKRGFGFHPLMAYLDATGEALAGLLRPGNAGSGTASDHVSVLVDALAQLPVDPAETDVIVRSDSAGWSHGFVDACRDRHVRFVIGHQLSVDIASVLVDVPEAAWQPAISADGSEWREHADVVEITDLVGDMFTGWPQGCRMIARREEPHPGAQLTFCDVDGHRFQVFATDLPDRDIAYLEALYRGRGRAERQICDSKATGLANLPSHSFKINHAWLQLVLTAHDLLAWCRLLALEGELATAEPKRLRYCLFHTAARITTSSRQRYCRLAASWPWTDDLITAFNRVRNLPLRC